MNTCHCVDPNLKTVEGTRQSGFARPIVFFSTDYLPRIGGVAAHVQELARAMRAMEQDVTVVTTRPRLWRQPSTWICRAVLNDGVPAWELPKASPFGKHGVGWQWRRGLSRLLRKRPSSRGGFVFHCHWGPTWWLDADCVRVFTNHTSTFLQALECGLAEGWCKVFKRYHWVIAPSRELADKTGELGFDPERITYIPNGVDTDRFRPDASRRAELRCELGIGPCDVLVLCARRFAPKNGVIDFAHALRFVDTSDTRVVVLFAGNSGNPRDAYEKETLGALQLSEVGRSARLLGEVPNSQIHRLYAAADISVLPSLKEATSITGLESMASGVPLIGTNVGGIPDLIEHEHDGLLVERGDPRGLAQAVGWLARHPHARADFAQRARQKAVSSFSWNEIARRTIEVYHKASQFAATSSGRLERTL